MKLNPALETVLCINMFQGGTKNLMMISAGHGPPRFARTRRPRRGRPYGVGWYKSFHIVGHLAEPLYVLMGDQSVFKAGLHSWPSFFFNTPFRYQKGHFSNAVYVVFNYTWNYDLLPDIPEFHEVLIYAISFGLTNRNKPVSTEVRVARLIRV